MMARSGGACGMAQRCACPLLPREGRVFLEVYLYGVAQRTMHFSQGAQAAGFWLFNTHHACLQSASMTRCCSCAVHQGLVQTPA